MIKQNYKFQFFLNTEDAEEIFVASIIIFRSLGYTVY